MNNYYLESVAVFFVRSRNKKSYNFSRQWLVQLDTICILLVTIILLLIHYAPLEFIKSYARRVRNFENLPQHNLFVNGNTEMNWLQWQLLRARGHMLFCHPIARSGVACTHTPKLVTRIVPTTVPTVPTVAPPALIFFLISIRCVKKYQVQSVLGTWYTSRGYMIHSQPLWFLISYNKIVT